MVASFKKSFEYIRCIRVVFLYLFPGQFLVLSSGLGAHVMSRRPLRSVRHKTSRPPSHVLCTKLYFQLALHLGTCASLRGQEPWPSLEDSNLSGLDLMSASIGEPERGFDEVSFSAQVLNRFLNTEMLGGTWHPELKSYRSHVCLSLLAHGPGFGI